MQQMDSAAPRNGEAPTGSGQVAIRGRDGQRAFLDTKQYSILHRLTGFDGEVLPTLVIVYLACVAITYLPLLAVASWGLATNQGIRLPFLLDWNITFTFLVSFPTLVILIVTDDHVLTQALQQVWSSDVISTNVEDPEVLVQTWTARFRWANIGSYAVGLVLGAILSWYTLQVYVWTKAGFWAAPTGVIEPIGVVYLYCITLLYGVIAVFVTRSVCIALFLSALVDKVTVRLLPFHPDGCGGLQPVGRLGLRNQLTLTILGLNIAILGFITRHYLVPHGAEAWMIIIAVLAYLILGPVVFIGPLLPFRTGMLRSKATLMGELSDRLRADFTAIRGRLKDDGLVDADLQTLERLKKVGSMIEGLPVWPFDARTLRTFGSAYLVPLVLPLLSKLVESGLVWLGVNI